MQIILLIPLTPHSSKRDKKRGEELHAILTTLTTCLIHTIRHFPIRYCPQPSLILPSPRLVRTETFLPLSHSIILKSCTILYATFLSSGCGMTCCSQHRRFRQGVLRLIHIRHAMPMPCRVISHIPCRAPAVLRHCRVLRESPRGSRKYPNC
jgi:hypothetical protein